MTSLSAFTFSVLGTVTVLLVTLMGMSQLGSIVGPSLRDGGQALTAPRLSVTIAPPAGQPLGPPTDRGTTDVGDHPVVATDAVDPPVVTTAVLDVHEQADPVTTVAFAMSPRAPAIGGPAPVPAADATPIQLEPVLAKQRSAAAGQGADKKAQHVAKPGESAKPSGHTTAARSRI